MFAKGEHIFDFFCLYLFAFTKGERRRTYSFAIGLPNVIHPLHLRCIAFTKGDRRRTCLLRKPLPLYPEGVIISSISYGERGDLIFDFLWRRGKGVQVQRVIVYGEGVRGTAQYSSPPKGYFFYPFTPLPLRLHQK